MTQIMDCTVFYSVIGSYFNIADRHHDPNLVRTSALVHIHAPKPALVPAGMADEEPQTGVTRLNIPHTVKGGPFFSNDTECIIVNGKNQILRIGGRYRFPVKMYRDLDDPNRFSIIFKEKEFCNEPEWVSL